MTAAFLQKYGDKNKASYFRRATDDGTAVTLSTLEGFQEQEIRRQSGFICSFSITRTLFSCSIIWCFSSSARKFIPQYFKDKDLHSTSKCTTTDHSGGARAPRGPRLCSREFWLYELMQAVSCSTTTLYELYEMWVHSQNWRLRLMMASVTPPTTSRTRKRFRPSILSREWTQDFSISRPDHHPSLQPGNNTETTQHLHDNPLS